MIRNEGAHACCVQWPQQRLPTLLPLLCYKRHCPAAWGLPTSPLLSPKHCRSSAQLGRPQFLPLFAPHCPFLLHSALVHTIFQLPPTLVHATAPVRSSCLPSFISALLCALSTLHSAFPCPPPSFPPLFNAWAVQCGRPGCTEHVARVVLPPHACHHLLPGPLFQHFLYLHCTP